MFERGAFTSYSACGIPYGVGGTVDDRDRLIARTPNQHRDRGIDVRLRHEFVDIDAEGIHGVQALTDGADLQRDLDAHRSRRAGVVGGGYIGLEIAEALPQCGLTLTIVKMAEHVEADAT